MMITKEQALELKSGDIIYESDAYNADGSQRRWRINGMVKTWKTRPKEFRVPIKYGLYDYNYLTHINASRFDLVEKV